MYASRVEERCMNAFADARSIEPVMSGLATSVQCHDQRCVLGHHHGERVELLAVCLLSL